VPLNGVVVQIPYELSDEHSKRKMGEIFCKNLNKILLETKQQ